MPSRTKKRKRRQSEVIKFTQEDRDYIRAHKEHLDESDAEAQRIARVRKKAGTPAHTRSALMEQRKALLEEKADARTRRRHFAAQGSSHTGDQHPEPTEKEYSSAKPVSRARLDAMVKLIQKCTAKWGPEPKGGWSYVAGQARKKSTSSSPLRQKQLIDDEILAEKCDSVDVGKAGRIGGRRKRRRRTRRRRRKSRRRRRTKRRRRTRRRRRRR